MLIGFYLHTSTGDRLSRTVFSHVAPLVIQFKACSMYSQRQGHKIIRMFPM